MFAARMGFMIANAAFVHGATRLQGIEGLKSALFIAVVVVCMLLANVM